MKERNRKLRNIAKLGFLHGNRQCNTNIFHMGILIITVEIIVTMELQ